MKKTLTLLLMLATGGIYMHAGINIGGIEYSVDTIMRRQVGPGIYNTIIRIPDFPLNVYLLEADLTNPYNRVETTIGYNTLGRTELLTNAYNRNRTETRRPIAACNANFWCVTGNGSPTMYLRGRRTKTFTIGRFPIDEGKTNCRSRCMASQHIRGQFLYHSVR